MALDRIRPLKLEDPATGGDELNPYPTEVEPNEDFADLRGVCFQDDTSNDEDVTISRDASGNLVFLDKVVADTKTLTDLLGGASGYWHPFKVDSGSVLTVPSGYQFDHLGRFKILGRMVVSGRMVLGIGATNGE